MDEGKEWAGLLSDFYASADPGYLLFLTGAVVADGTVFVTDFGNNRVQKWQQGATE